MAPKKRQRRRLWWRRRRPLQRLAIALFLAAAVGVAGWLVLLAGGDDGGDGTSEYLVEPAPSFTLPTIAGDEVTLADHLGRHNLLLYFNEGMGCAPCWDQIVDLEEEWERFEALDTALVSIMVDPLGELAAEAQRRGITSIVAADEDKSVSTVYDALEASMHPGIKPGHTFILINKVGQIIWRWDWIGHGRPMYVEVDDLYDDIARWLELTGEG